MFNLKLIARTAVSIAAGSLLTTAIHAQDIDNRANVYGGVVEYLFDSDWNQGDDLGWLVGGEVPVGDRWALTLEHYDLQPDNDSAPGDADFTYSRFGGNYHLNPRGNWQPYLSAGLGYGRLKNSLPSKGVDEGSFDFGVGVKHFFNDNLFLRGDAKAIRITDIGTWDYALGLGLGYAFGPKSRPAPAPVAAAPEADSDGDGVVDSRDKCPGTPRNLAVDADGCPIMDSSMVSQDLLVQFDFDKSEIKPEFYSRIAEFAQFMTTYTNTNVVIEGHTDSVGADAYNQGLSERRAQAVMNRLITTHGIAASRLTARGFGESMPRASNDTTANRALNRRIMAEVAAQVQEQRQR